MQFIRAIIVFTFAVQAVSAASIRLQSDRHLDELSPRNRPWAVQMRPEQKDLIRAINHLGASIDDAAASFSSLTLSTKRKIPFGWTVRAEGDDLRDALAPRPAKPSKTSAAVSDFEGTLSNESRRLGRIGASLSQLALIDREALSKWRVKRTLKKLEKRILRLERSYAGLRERVDFVATDTLDWQIERLLGAVRTLRGKAR